jgi:hypothetical protein
MAGNSATFNLKNKDAFMGDQEKVNLATSFPYVSG